MSPDLTGIIAAVALLVPTIHVIRSRGFDAWAWPLILATLPVYYMLMGLLAMDGGAIVQELLWGLPYIAVGLFVWRIRSRMALTVVALSSVLAP